MTPLCWSRRHGKHHSLSAAPACDTWSMNQFLRDFPTFDAGRAERAVGVFLPAEYNPIAPHAKLLALGANSSKVVTCLR